MDAAMNPGWSGEWACGPWQRRERFEESARRGERGERGSPGGLDEPGGGRGRGRSGRGRRRGRGPWGFEGPAGFEGSQGFTEFGPRRGRRGAWQAEAEDGPQDRRGPRGGTGGGRGSGRGRGHGGPGGPAGRRGGWFGAEGPFGPGGPFGADGPFGPEGPFGPGGPFGPAPFGGPGRGRGRRGGRARRGDVRNAALLLLAEGPRNGYQLIQELGERSGGAWKPSPGAVYPALSQLEDEGLIEACEHEGRKAFRLTDSGRGEAEKVAEGRAPWESDEPEPELSGGLADLGTAYGQVKLATRAVMQTGDEQMATAAAQVLDAARRDLYRLLADGLEDEEEDDIQDDVRR